MCVRAWSRLYVCVRACVHACVCVCVYALQSAVFHRSTHPHTEVAKIARYFTHDLSMLSSKTAQWKNLARVAIEGYATTSE